jgi:hypothetical protein
MYILVQATFFLRSRELTEIFKCDYNADAIKRSDLVKNESLCCVMPSIRRVFYFLLLTCQITIRGKPTPKN